jgi:ketosteroid isomerase-like protein
MKLLPGGLPIVMFALVLPASAQTVDPIVRQSVERIIATYAEQFNKQDAAGIAIQYTNDGVLFSESPLGVLKSGPQMIAKNYERLFKLGANHLDISLGRLAPIGSDVAIGIGEYHVTGQGKNGPIKIDGDWSATYVRDAGTWKIRILNAIQRPAAPATK